jgi:tetratricopeptide (TPR) repeat protein
MEMRGLLPSGRILLLFFVIGAPLHGQSALEKGKAALDNHQYVLAEGFLAKAESEAPGKTNALALRAKALINLERFGEAKECLDRYLGIHPTSPDGTYLLGYIEFRLDAPAQSLTTFTKAAQLQTPTAGDLKIVGLDYVLLNDFSDAARWLEQSVAGNPNDPESQYYLGRAYYVLNSFEKAIVAFQRTLELKSGDAKAEDNLGLCFDALNQPEKAEEAFRQAIAWTEKEDKPNALPYIDLADLLIRKPENGEVLTLLSKADTLGGAPERIHELKARAYFAENRLAEAEAQIRADITLKPENSSFHYLLGRILKKEGKSGDAEKEFALTKTLLGTHSAEAGSGASEPPNVGDHLRLAKLYGGDHPDEALTELGKVLAIAPENSQASEMVRKVAHDGALSLLRQGKRLEALSLLSHATQLLPSDGELLYEYGLTVLEAGDSAKACEVLTKALELRPDSSETLYALARADLAQNRSQEAESLMRRYLKAKPDDATAQYGLGYILIAEQKLNDAQAAFEKSLQIAPNQTESVFQLGEIALEQDHVDAARSRFRQVLQKDPTHAGALTETAVIQYRAGRYSEAKSMLESAIERTPDYQKARYYHGLTLLKLGDKEAAEKEFAVARSLQKVHGSAGPSLQ